MSQNRGTPPIPDFRRRVRAWNPLAEFCNFGRRLIKGFGVQGFSLFRSGYVQELTRCLPGERGASHGPAFGFRFKHGAVY